MSGPPRKRFQIHLSTAIVLMFVAGPLLWANVVFRHDAGLGPMTAETTFSGRKEFWQKLGEEKYFGLLSDADDIELTTIGWPCEFAWNAIGSFNKNGIVEHKLVAKNPQLYYFSAIVDIVVCPLILFAVWFLCEWLIRRRVEGS